MADTFLIDGMIYSIEEGYNSASQTSYGYGIYNCSFESKAVTVGETTTAAYGCIKVADDANKNATLEMWSSVCYNDTAKPAVYINGTTAVVTDGNNVFYSANGGILAKANTCTLNQSVCLTTGEYDAAKAADDKTQLDAYDQTENGNNGNAAPATLTEPEETTTAETSVGETTAETTAEETTAETTAEETTAETTAEETTEETTAEETTAETTAEETTEETTAEETTAETTAEETTTEGNAAEETSSATSPESEETAEP